MKGYALSLPPLHRRCEWPGRGGWRQINNPVASPPRPALKDRECQPGTRLKSAAKPLKISQVQSKTAKFRVGHRNQAEGRGMSEAVTVEDKTNRYNANAHRKTQNSCGRPLKTHTPPWRRRVAAVSTPEADQLMESWQRSSR